MNDSSESLGPSTERAMLEAILDGNGELWDRLASELSAERALRIMAIATSAVIFRKWPDDPSLQEVAAYVVEIKTRFPADLPVAAAIIEAVIRAVFGESELLDGIAGEEVFIAESLIIKSMQYDVLISSEDRQSYLSEVLTAAK